MLIALSGILIFVPIGAQATKYNNKTARRRKRIGLFMATSLVDTWP
jgi:hypothetical protein